MISAFQGVEVLPKPTHWLLKLTHGASQPGGLCLVEYSAVPNRGKASTESMRQNGFNVDSLGKSPRIGHSMSETSVSKWREIFSFSVDGVLL